MSDDRLAEIKATMALASREYTNGETEEDGETWLARYEIIRNSLDDVPWLIAALADAEAALAASVDAHKVKNSKLTVAEAELVAVRAALAGFQTALERIAAYDCDEYSPGAEMEVIARDALAAVVTKDSDT